MTKLVLRWTIGLALGLGGMAAHLAAQIVPPQAQIPPAQVAPQVEKCLHGNDETAAEKSRRDEALAAMRMIDWVRSSATPMTRPWQWSNLNTHPAVRELQERDGQVGELARKVQWGKTEPLPGWGMLWRIEPAVPRSPLDSPVVFSLIDRRDPCGFRYLSTDPEVMRAGRPGLRLLDGY